MITIFNRREVLVTFDYEAINNAREILCEAKIPYLYKIQKATRAHKAKYLTETSGNGSSFRLLNRIYVKKSHYHKAKILIEGGIHK